jgi:hypothetical protein
MKLRTPQYAAIALLAFVVMIGLYDILFDVRSTAMYNDVLKDFYEFLCFAMGTAAIVLLWRFIWLELFVDYWQDMDVTSGFKSYPVRKFDWLVPNAIDESRDVQIKVKIAGVDAEVFDTTTPEDYGLTSHISYVVHRDDLCFMDEEELVYLINKTYHCNYKVNEK